MKNREYEQLLTATLLYLATFVFLNLFILSVLSVLGFSMANLVFAMGAAALPAAFFGYLIAQHAQIGQRSTRQMLQKLLRNSLHEIKIPVATIRANTQMLKKSAEGKTQERLERINRATGKLEGLYEELDYFISREIRRVQKKPIALHKLTKERAELFEEALIGWDFSLTLQPVWVMADAMAFKKILDNLIDNAMKYSPKERRYLSIRLDRNRLQIEDRGIGMSPDAVARVFERFFQANPHQTGFGIGLDIVKAACDEHAIPIRIDSQEGQGTTITLELASVVIEEPHLQE
ncbi:MAG: sensor histidine kinase [Campylobacterales bacterium]